MSEKIASYLTGVLGAGPATETALVGRLMARGIVYETAVLLVKNALCDLMQFKVIEQVPGISVYRLTTQMCVMEPKGKS